MKISCQLSVVSCQCKWFHFYFSKIYSSKKSLINRSPATGHRILMNGFSLIELLVVIAMIASLLAVLFPNFMAMRQRARDAERKSDVTQIQKALELYKLDQNPQSFPTDITLGASLCRTCWSSQANCSGNVYMRKFPCDPNSANPTPYIYVRDPSNNLKYSLVACLENPADPDRDSAKNASCTWTSASFTLYEP